MQYTAIFLRVPVAVALLGLAAVACAQQSETFGDYEVHYNALNSDMLSPEIASAYGIRRAPGSILLNVTLLKDDGNGTASPAAARVQATAVNLSGQRRDIEMREVGEQGALYYIGEMRVRNEENFNFTLNVTPADNPDAGPMEVTFRKQFYTE